MATTKKVAPIVATSGDGGGDFELPEPGVYLARCYKMVDVGTQKVQFQNKPVKRIHQVYLWWELLQDADGNDVRMSDGEGVFSIFKQYTLSMHEKANLRADVDSWRGVPFTEDQAKEFDITKLLDKYCLLQVIHKPNADKSKTYANVSAIMTTKKKVDGVNEVEGFSIANPNMEMFEEFPDWLKDKIKAAEEWKVETADGPVNADGEPDEDVEIEDLGGEPLSPEELKDVPF